MVIDKDYEVAFNEALVARTKSLREQKGWSQSKMALRLGVPLERYKKYEQRTPLPHHLLEPFADLVGVDIHFMVTGARRRT